MTTRSCLSRTATAIFGRRWVRTALVCAAMTTPDVSLVAQSAEVSGADGNRFLELNSSVQELTKRVSPSVVQVQVTGYRPMESGDRGDGGVVLGRQHRVGSGAIIAADGYIVTNAHVVAGAERVQVVLYGSMSEDGPVESLAAQTGRTVDAQVVGTARDIDLALLKVEIPGLRPIPIANYDKVRQGQLVFAFGSPEGLDNSVTMGVISAVARQTDLNSPNVFIQTDAPINPGSSGGPLVNIDGELVGLNTFIISSSGFSQGLGFAIPSSVVAAAYPDLRKNGRLHHAIIGVNVQGITPALAAGLRLSTTRGVVVADVIPASPADNAGVMVQDVIVSADAKPVNSVPVFALAVKAHSAGDSVTLGLLRGTRALSLAIPILERPNDVDQVSDLADPAKNSILALGIIGADVTPDTADLLPMLRFASGVIVAARNEDSRDHGVPLMTGDVIHALNGIAVRSMDGLRVLLNDLKRNSDIVLQIERNSHLIFVTCRLY